MKRISSLFILPLALSTAMVQADYYIDKNFTVKKDGLLQIDSDRGQVSLSSHDKNEIRVEVDVRGSKADDFEVKIEEVGSGLEINGDYNGSQSSSHNHVKVKYTIVVPKEYNLDVRTAGGNIKAQNIVGDIKLKTSGGGIKISDVIGQVSGHTSGGSINVEDVKGATDIRTSGGSIEVEELVGDLGARTSGGSIRLKDINGNTDVRTSGGSISINEFSGDGSLDARTSGGSVTANISSQVKQDLSLMTSGGSVTLKVPENDYESFSGVIKKKYIEGKLNHKTALMMKTSGGRVSFNPN